MSVQHIDLKAGDSAYVALPASGERRARKSISLDDLISDYRGPRVVLDFGADQELIGVEILASTAATQ